MLSNPPQTLTQRSFLPFYRVLHAHLRSCIVVCVLRCFRFVDGSLKLSRGGTALPTYEHRGRSTTPAHRCFECWTRSELVTWQRRRLYWPAARAACEPFSPCFLYRSLVPCQTATTAPIPIVVLLTAGCGWMACARLSATPLRSLVFLASLSKLPALDFPSRFLGSLQCACSRLSAFFHTRRLFSRALCWALLQQGNKQTGTCRHTV